MPKKGKKKGVQSRKAGRHHPYEDDSYDIPPNGPPSIQDELDQALEKDPGQSEEQLPDPRVEGPNVSISINLDTTDTGESVSTATGDTTMISGIDPQGTNALAHTCTQAPTHPATHARTQATLSLNCP